MIWYALVYYTNAMDFVIHTLCQYYITCTIYCIMLHYAMLCYAMLYYYKQRATETRTRTYVMLYYYSYEQLITLCYIMLYCIILCYSPVEQTAWRRKSSLMRLDEDVLTFLGLGPVFSLKQMSSHQTPARELESIWRAHSEPCFLLLFPYRVLFV